jgi:mannose-6-phosphate isomerase-like protein (cupin superfamily)
MHIVPKTWGREKWLANTELYCGKELVVKPQGTCSIHYHIIKDETFAVIDGNVLIETYPHGKAEWRDIDPSTDPRSETELLKLLGPPQIDILRIGTDSIRIPPGLPHRFRGLTRGDRDSSIIETSTTHFDEDSYRLLDSLGIVPEEEYRDTIPNFSRREYDAVMENLIG